AAYGSEPLAAGGTWRCWAALVRRGAAVYEGRSFPEMLGGRVKTPPPAVHGGVLAIRSNPAHVEAMRLHHIQPIDLVVVNLYPFERTTARGADFDDCIENIDIGGPALIPAAATKPPPLPPTLHPTPHTL